MALWSTIIGFSLWGLGARVGQLGIQKRPLLTDPHLHAAAMAAFGIAGYWAHKWEVTSNSMLEDMRTEIKEKRAKQIAAAEEVGNTELAQWLKERL
ncbi:hypothetical protein K488DRAFT_83077 [Vararia minispora EC-137]|uniref:Uncharacterized protein n=1 Tax=Vararia minispora EC-137 TaxID=1314806 RepID=A0ACB8QU75_9AGAM|nr:hypothetical protein K488DRAFT_83077 [Vararia minispora EC-137]